MVSFITFKNYYFIIAGVAILLIVGLSIFISYLVKKNKLLKTVNAMKNTIEDNHSDYFQTYFKKLGNIAEKNNAYQDIYIQMLEQGNKLLNDDKEMLIGQQIQLSKRCKIEKYNKNLKEQVKQFQLSIDQYKKDLSSLEKTLSGIFDAGDKLRSHCTELAKKFRSVKDDLATYQASLDTCYESLSSFIMDIDAMFDIFEDYMKDGLYEEASKKLDTIKKSVYLCYGNIETIAQYNNMLVTILPGQIKELEDKNVKMQEDGYNVSYIRVDEFAKNAYALLEDCKKQFGRLYFAEFKDISDEISNKITDIWQRLDKEENAKNTLDKKSEEVINKINRVGTEFIHTKRQFSTVNEYYKLPDDIVERFRNYESNSTKLSDLKREYDNYNFANTKNPATFMLEKVNNMDAYADQVMADISFLSSYFKEVKDYVEETYVQVDKLGVELIETLGLIRKNKCKKVYDKYRSVADSLINDLRNVNNLLHEKPINIIYIREMFGPLINEINDTKTKMINEMNNYFTVEKCLLYANPLRSKFNEVDNILNEVEKNFIEGNYKEANEKVRYVLNNFHVDTFDAFK